MCRIEVAVAGPRMVAPPQALAFGAELDLTEIVQVATLAVQDFSEHALANHVQDHRLPAAVVHVLHHEAVLFVLFGVLHESPAVFDGVRSRHLCCRMLIVLHRGHANGHMPLPRGGVVHQVEFLLLAHPHEIPLAAVVTLWFGLAGLDSQLLHSLDLLGDDVAHGLEFHSLDAKQVPPVSGPHASNAYESDSYDVHRRCRKGLGWCLTHVGRWGGSGSRAG